MSRIYSSTSLASLLIDAEANTRSLKKFNAYVQSDEIVYTTADINMDNRISYSSDANAYQISPDTYPYDYLIDGCIITYKDLTTDTLKTRILAQDQIGVSDTRLNLARYGFIQLKTEVHEGHDRQYIITPGIYIINDFGSSTPFDTIEIKIIQSRISPNLIHWYKHQVRCSSVRLTEDGKYPKFDFILDVNTPFSTQIKSIKELSNYVTYVSIPLDNLIYINDEECYPLVKLDAGASELTYIESFATKFTTNSLPVSIVVHDNVTELPHY